MTQATPSTQNQNQNQNQNQHEGQAAEQTKRPRRARRPASSARSATPAKGATPAAETAGAPAEPAAQPHMPEPQAPAHEQPQAQQAPQARPRRPRRAAQPQAQQQAASAAPAHAQTPLGELPQPQQPAAALPAPGTAAPAGTETAEAAAAQQKKRTTRGGRGHRGGRKSEVQLVKPAEAPAEPPELQTAEPAFGPTVPSGAAVQTAAPGQMETEPRVVPVVTQVAPVPVAPLPVAAHGEPGTEPGATAAFASTAAPSPAASRFRFGRRAPGLAPETAAPAALAPSRESEPMAAAAVPTPMQPAVEAPEAPETWQATVAEVAPESLPTATDTRASAVDDLVAALGLQGAAPIAPRGPEAAEATEPAPPEAAAEAEAETEEEHQTTRRRRRRRGKSTSAAAAGEETAVESLTVPEWGAERELRNGYERAIEQSQPYSPYNRPPRERLAPVAEPEQPEESPFGSPEPQMARGFGPQPRGVAGPAPSALQRPARERERLETPPMSPNQLGTMLTHAIQQQTDRLLGELRHQPQGPAMTFAVPLPSTERVGIFVDVANLLYSARSQRINLDFGKLLDFLRGNRRLIRAHAYAPTNPEPGAEQSFLNAVRGLGYRITTKNFKTFASGAKKADMDLDLCMDIVRMVDAGALDTVVLVSGDSDFLPLLEYASDRGVRVEVAAFDDSAAMILRQSCDLFINLSLVEGLQK